MAPGLFARAYRATIHSEQLPLDSRICAKCGRDIPAGETACPCGASQPHRYWLHSRETILLLSFVGLVAAFLVTGTAVRAYHQRRRILAESWFEKGSGHLQNGQPALALTDLETALTYARGRCVRRPVAAV